MKNPTLITLAGAAGSGKDTLGKMLANHFGYQIDRFAKPIYDLIESMIGANYEELQDRELKHAIVTWLGKSPRELLQSLGTEWGRDMVCEEVWARCLEYRNKHILQPTENDAGGLIVPDARFLNEAEFTRAYDGVLVWVLKPDLELISTSGHRSENGLTADDCDVTVLNNSSIEALHQRIPIIVEAIQAVHEENLRQKARRQDAEQTV